MKLKTIASLLLLVLSCISASAQEEEELRDDWLAKDIEAIQQFLPPLKRIDATIDSISRVFGREPKEAHDLGFGGRSFMFDHPGGYTHFSVTGFTYNGRIGYYRIVQSSSDWPKVRNHIIEAWKANNGSEFEEGEYGLSYYVEYASTIAEYKSVVASQLGEPRPVKVALQRREGYEYLISLKNNSVVGSGGCGYGGVTPAGKSAMDQLINSRKVQMIENVLKGYNPGARVYALLGLLKLQRDGIELSPETQNTMRAVLELDIQIQTCDGCVHSWRKAKEIVGEWKL